MLQRHCGRGERAGIRRRRRRYPGIHSTPLLIYTGTHPRPFLSYQNLSPIFQRRAFWRASRLNLVPCHLLLRLLLRRPFFGCNQYQLKPRDPPDIRAFSGQIIYFPFTMLQLLTGKPGGGCATAGIHASTPRLSVLKLTSASSTPLQLSIADLFGAFLLPCHPLNIVFSAARTYQVLPWGAPQHPGFCWPMAKNLFPDVSLDYMHGVYAFMSVCLCWYQLELVICPAWWPGKEDKGGNG